MRNLLQDIPMPEYSKPDDLFGIDEVKYPNGDDDFYQHGWGLVENKLILSDKDTGDEKFSFDEKKKVIVVILHSSDHPPYQKDDIEIAFWVDDDHIWYLTEEIEARTSLNKFIGLRLDKILEECHSRNVLDLVLCTCNPHHSIIKRPTNIPTDMNVYFPLGIVDHWRRNFPNKKSEYDLTAANWIKL